MSTFKSNLKFFFTVCVLLTLLTPSIINIGVPTNIKLNQNNENDTQSVVDSMHDDQDLQHFEISSIDFETMNYTIYDTSESFESYILCVLYQRHRITSDYSNSLIIMAHNGSILYSLDVGSIGNFQCPAEFINPNTVLFGTSSGAALWHINNDTVQYLSFIGHHEYEYNPNSNTIFTFEYYRPQIDGVWYQFDYIREYALNGTLVWSMDVYDFMSEDWWCPYGDLTWGTYGDVSHSNTAFYDVEEDIIYYNARNTNTFWKINHSSSEVIWGLGEYGNFTLYNLDGELRNTLFYHAHAVEKVNENTFIIFDNDYHNQTNPDNKISRVVEIVVDEDTMIANETWYYSFPREYFSGGMGDADRLPNGNRLGASGYIDPIDGILSAAFVEVNEQGDVVWEADFYHNPNYIYGAYRVERFRYEPIITPVPDIEEAFAPASIDWDVFYNYRNKEKLPGEYFLYVDDVEIENGSFTYEQFWQPTTLSLSPGSLSLGVHNVTLEVTDGYGHSQFDSVNVTIGSFSLERSGNTTLEKGQQNNLPTWKGFTTTSLDYNITLNVTLFEAASWSGTDIVLDLDLIDLGLHNVTLRMFNGTEELYTDTFWLRVTPSEPPVIIPLQSTTLSMNWNSSLLISWNITDVTGKSWELYLNNSFTTGGLWTPPDTLVDWDVPLLVDGLYNITLIADDAIGQYSSSTCWLTVLPPPNPTILSSPGNQTLIWGAEEVSLVWEVYQGDSWELEKNGVVYRSGILVDGNVTLDDIDWFEEDWRIGLHNLTLILYLGELNAIDTIFVTISLDLGDPFADDYIPAYSDTILFGSNAIGAPDSNYAVIFIDYSNGYITLDMGRNEEILDGDGADFSVVAIGDTYSVYVGDSLETSLIYLGASTGSTSFDISTTGLEQVRYLRIAVSSGEEVSIDAVVAHYYNVPTGDDENPAIESIDDYSMVLGEVTTLNWSAFDSTPFEYEILVNSTEVESDLWNGSFIVYHFEPDMPGLWNVTLVLYDGFGNIAQDTVMIEVYVPESNNSIVPLLIAVGVGASSLVAFILLWKFKKSS